jgi:hypothetical protein
MLVPAAASAALVVASWLAQAEPAPPEEPPQAAAAPGPGASPGPMLPPEELTPRRPINTVSVHGRLATRPSGPDAGVPREGFSLGGSFDHRYAGLAETFGFGVALDFFFDHFSTGPDQNSFVALQTVVFDRAAVRPWLGVGGGVAVAIHDTRAVARGALGLELPFTRANSIAVRADLTHALAGDRAFADLLDVGVGFVQHF